MQLDSARELKQLLQETILAPLTGGDDGPVKSLALAAGPMSEAATNVPSIALGIAKRTSTDFRLAVRTQRRELQDGKEVEQIRKKAKNEIDVRYIGRVAKRAVPWVQVRHRPLKIGTSVGHVKITAGTLGCFVTQREGGGTFILSNNHVLANENRGKVGDAILQPGPYDDGKDPADVIARLAQMVRLKKSGKNFVDCAIAEIANGTEFDARSIRGVGKLAGLGSEFLDEGTEVAKLGRTTGLTKGRVTAFELDNVVVRFDIGNLRFDNQVEIEGAGDEMLSAGGDSGSLIVTAADRLAVALLFAGSDAGGSNDQGLTFANPIRPVLDGLKVDLLT
jgi:hypothetical protein